jgi:two-component system, NtrC family, sensor histidine kinase HydH
MWTQFTAVTRTFQWCVCALLAGLVADAAGRAWAAEGFWTQLLSNGYYVGIVFAAIGFGPRGGLISGAVAGISHLIIMALGPRIPSFGWGESVAFVLAGLLAGFIARRNKMSREAETTTTWPQARQTNDLGFGSPVASNHFTTLGQAAPTLVHELRTPLASIEGAGFVLEDATLSEEKRQELVAIILKECQRIDLLVGLIGASHPRFEHDELDVSSLLDEVIRVAGATADAASHPLRKAVSPEFPHLVCNSELIRQVIINLTINAMYATPPGREIVLSAHSIDNQVFIEVIDQRLGVGEESLDSMLDRSSPNEHWRVQLATARQVAVQHGGAVKVKRNDNKGITTSIVLPGSC